VLPPLALERLRIIISAFYHGVPGAQAADLLEELRCFPSVFRLDPSDISEAPLMLVCMEFFDLPNGDGTWTVWTPAENDDDVPSAIYLRPDAAGVWWAWYPGESA
jgi:hypothetical protein